ncbi:hypothetical protein [Microbulbifer marinus]|uniref:DUF7931 domain-containing protein n=1 Tax=Microbulbifer marinus TaxID=658218 RepID=A0A1H3W4L4_9GAMM|nr:hypothetical protein [Microbulbifer marinus]SDZ82055.1 hypothetical protein SAMN05216562_0552 [Microbulbifer marinus]
MTEQTSAEYRSLEDLAGFRTALVELLSGARREVCIFSEQLARGLYHEKAVAEALSAFARGSHFARVRILVRDTTSIIGRFHRIHELAQRLSTRIDIRKVEATVDTPDWEFVIADGQQVLQCEDRDQWLGVFYSANPVRARQLLDLFEQDWPLAATDPNLRRLSL